MTAPPKCACRAACGDVAEEDDDPLAVCKGLPMPRSEGRLVERPGGAAAALNRYDRLYGGGSGAQS